MTTDQPGEVVHLAVHRQRRVERDLWLDPATGWSYDPVALDAAIAAADAQGRPVTPADTDPCRVVTRAEKRRAMEAAFGTD